MAQAFVMTAMEPWVGDRRTLWVVLADTPDLALEAARADGRQVDEVVGTLSEETVDLAGAARPGPGLFTENKSSEVNGPSNNSLRSR
jgi:hypothetical protein